MLYAQSILITNNKNLIKLVNLSLKKQLKKITKKKYCISKFKKFWNSNIC